MNVVYAPNLKAYATSTASTKQGTAQPGCVSPVTRFVQVSISTCTTLAQGILLNILAYMYTVKSKHHTITVWFPYLFFLPLVFFGGNFMHVPSETLKLCTYPSEIHNIAFTLLNFKNHKIYPKTLNL